MKEVIRQFAERIRAAGAQRPLRLRGGGSKDFYGQIVAGDVLDTRPYAGVVAYDPSELVITARCGTSLADLQAILQEKDQWLAFEPPAFGVTATVGGMVAAGLAGPGRGAAGAVRDFVLGARIMNARGDVLTFGGQVMKNVAGYDASRLMAGSLGTLGLILEISLKVTPRPRAAATLRFEMPQGQAIQILNQWAGRPLPITASVIVDTELTVRVAGAEAAVAEARTRLGGEVLESDPARRFWLGIREQTDAFFLGDAPLWRVSVPSNAPELPLRGDQLIEWGGALRWFRTGAEARVVREAAARCGGHATLFRGGDKSQGVFHPLAPALARIHRRLKSEFDPESVFNPGRMYSDL